MLKTQGLLKDPNFKLLADAVSVENTHITLPEVAGHEFRIRIYRPAQKPAEPLPVLFKCKADNGSEAE